MGNLSNTQKMGKQKITQLLAKKIYPTIDEEILPNYLAIRVPNWDGEKSTQKMGMLIV